MRRSTTLALMLGAALVTAVPALSQPPPRADALWARSTAGAHITLDGVLNEPAWALAESVTVGYRVENGIPGSGWKEEGGKLAKDPTHATLKFLVDGNQLYMAATVPDSSIGGSVDFNRFDGFLMALKNHDTKTATRPAPPAEYFYSWWYPVDTTLANTVGIGPCFRGLWAPDTCHIPRTATQIANWDAVTQVNGLTNSDGTIDQSYITEMRFNLTPMGYDVTKPEGDVVEWNVSIYDTDWYWPINLSKFSVNRSWIESPWGNAAWYDEVHIFARPEITINSGPAPIRPPDALIPNEGSAAAPVIDGSLSDPVWATVPGFHIRYGDAALRNSYGAVGKWRSGQYHPFVNGDTAAVSNPADATVKAFWKDNKLYLGFDVFDQVVQYVSNFDRWDGFIVTLTDRVKRYTDNNLYTWRITFQVGSDGHLLAQDQLPYLRDTLFAAEAGLQLKAGTTVDTAGTSPDQGYTAELALDLTKFGYPAGLGDHIVFLGIDLLNGDSFTPFTNSYGTRTWWYRQYENDCCPAWVYLYPTALTGVGSGAKPIDFVLLGSAPNPFRVSTRIRYAIPEWGNVTLEAYDVLGRLAARRFLGLQGPGEHDAILGREGLSSGVYLYRLRIADPKTGAVLAKLAGKTMFLR